MEHGQDIDIIKVSDAIDELLNRTKWTRRELSFYHMLLSKVRHYRNRLPNAPASPVRDLSGDTADIHANIVCQRWYQTSHNQGTISSLYGNMRIKECKHQGEPGARNYHYKLDLVLQGRIHLIMEVMRDARSTVQYPYHFRIYYELQGGCKAHIAAYTPGKTKGHSLPEYENLRNIFPSLQKHEIVCLAIEMVLYYDVDHIMEKLPLGNSYPITIGQLMKGIIDNL